MRKPSQIWTYAFLPHDSPVKFSTVFPHRSPQFSAKKRAAFLQLVLRRNATRYIFIIADSNGNFKCISLLFFARLFRNQCRTARGRKKADWRFLSHRSMQGIYSSARPRNGISAERAVVLSADAWRTSARRHE